MADETDLDKTIAQWGEKQEAIRLGPAKPSFVRMFTSITKVTKTGALEKQFFDVPLLKAPQPMQGAWTPQPPQMTDWQWFMTNLLQHRGMLVENAWIPERMIELLMVNPDPETTLENADLTNVVRLR